MKKLTQYFSNNRSYPILTALAAGLYPLLFYYSNNFTLINSWGHLVYFLIVFLALPIAVMVGFYYAFKWSKLAPYRKYILPFFNLFFFLAFVRICLSAGIWSNWLFTIFAVALVFTILF
ncbi:MAG: hypothetical protein HKN48_00510, partial [Flavobacteriaceae bacterium]|nr:hypothetical protein [Flavobacteriaceae bacterium]